MPPVRMKYKREVRQLSAVPDMQCFVKYVVVYSDRGRRVANWIW